MKSAHEQTQELRRIIERRTGIALSFDDANTLRRAQLTLHRWAEMECGDGNNVASWCIERDEATGKPFNVVYPHDGKSRRYAIPDREAGALKRISEICQRTGLQYFHQTDPRGCSLYVSNQPLTDSQYNRGVACCA